MSTRLKAPPSNLHDIALELVELEVASLYRISKHDSGEPYFGRSAGNRFDDHSLPASGRFGTSYMATSLCGALAETVLHDLMPQAGHFIVPPDELESKYLVRFEGASLRLAKLTGIALKRIVGSSEISTVLPYDLPQSWAIALHAHPAKVDGILYMSRQLNDDKAVVVFDRAKRKFNTAVYTPLPGAPGFDEVIQTLAIRGG